MNHSPYPNPPGQRKWPLALRAKAKHLWTVDWIPLEKIAIQIGVPLSTVKAWKCRAKTPWMRQDRLKESLLASLRGHEAWQSLAAHSEPAQLAAAALLILDKEDRDYVIGVISPTPKPTLSPTPSTPQPTRPTQTIRVNLETLFSRPAEPPPRPTPPTIRRLTYG